ncbi:MAG TPA: hypothetical protein VFG95_07860 [Nitrospiria bacterium]|nr:hypothetical protein [Nitrospiria bacterium]
MTSRKVFWSTLIALGILSGCASTKGSIAPSGPAWVNKGSGAFSDGGTKAFYGVGAVTGIRNKPLAVTAADNRARAEITKIFETYTASLMRDYTRTTTAGDMQKTSEEQDVEQAVKTFSAATLSGVFIVDHWQDPADGTLYSLAKLDLDKFKENIDKAKELNAAVRDYVRNNSEKAFNELATEEEKHK